MIQVKNRRSSWERKRSFATLSNCRVVHTYFQFYQTLLRMGDNDREDVANAKRILGTCGIRKVIYLVNNQQYITRWEYLSYDLEKRGRRSSIANRNPWERRLLKERKREREKRERRARRTSDRLDRSFRSDQIGIEELQQNSFRKFQSTYHSRISDNTFINSARPYI